MAVRFNDAGDQVVRADPTTPPASHLMIAHGRASGNVMPAHAAAQIVPGRSARGPQEFRPYRFGKEMCSKVLILWVGAVGLEPTAR